MFVALVIVHELGHFFVARRNGVVVEEFGLGFPPKIWGRKLKSGLLFTVNLLPIGGFVRLKGESDSAAEKGSFGAASLRAKVKILLAGVAMNLVTALALFTLLALVGMPKLVENQFTVASDTKIIQEIEHKGVVLLGDITADSPAAIAGLGEEDEMISIDGVVIDTPAELATQTKANAGKAVTLQVLRKDATQPENIAVTLNQSSPYLGVRPYSGETGAEIRRSTWSAPVVALGVSAQFTQLSFQGLGNMLGSLFAGQVSQAADSVAGPVRTFQILDISSDQGISFVLMVIALISLTLAIMNTLPIPALDGGRLFLILAYRLRNKPLSEKTESLVNGIGFVALILLSIAITIREVSNG